MSIQVSRTFQLSPGILSRDVDAKISELVKTTMVGSCSEENGYITEVRDVSIKNALVSEATGLVDFSVVFDAVCVNPTEGSRFGGRVCLVFDMGVLIDVAGIFKILVPVCDGKMRLRRNADLGANGEAEQEVVHETTEDGSQIKSVSDDSINLTKGSLARVVVSGVQYNPDTNVFNCFGDLII